jgi:PKD repeat protein
MAQFGTDGGIYLGTNAGVFYRNNSHSDWQPYSTGLPASVETNRLKPFYRDNKIRNGCWGFGVWESPLFEPSLPQAMPTVASRMVGCNRDTVYFDDYSVLNHSGAAWQWSFPGASYISSTTVRNPKVIYSIPGIYDVSLAITNALNQTDSKTIQGMVIVQTRCQPDTIPGKALVAEGSEKHGYVQDINLQNVNTLTITAWVKPNGIQPDYSAIFMGEGNDAAGFNFKDGSNQLAYHWPGGQWWWNSGINVPADQWSFVAMVVKPTGVTLYCNNQSATHNFTLTPTNIPSFRIGSYRNWGSRNMNGKIDEVAIYNRSLTTQEIRELQHLTKKPSNDPSLIAYYQFNTDDTHDYDKVGLHHVLLVGGAVKEVSTAPFGGGASQRLNINSGGLKNFNNVDFKIWHPVSGVYPNGEVVVTKINLRPDVNAPGAFQPNCYWVINNYGTNSTFAVPDSIRFFNSGNISGGCQASYFRLFRRAANADGNSWGNYIDLGDYYNPYPPDVFVTFSTGNNVNSFGQFVMTRDNRPNGDAVEICNGIDDNCDGRIDESYDLIVSNAADNGANTLRAILNCAQSGDTIRFGANIDTITLLSPLVLTKNLVLQDDIGPKVVLKTNLSGAGFNNASAAIQVSSGSTTTCINIHLLQSNNNLNKPVLFNAGSLVLESCKISGNPDSVIKNNLGAGFHARGLVEINK